MKIKKILVPLDGSDIAKQALQYAFSIAQRYDTTILLLRVVPSHDYIASNPSILLDGGMELAHDYKMISQLQEQEHETAVSYLSKKQAALEQDGITCEIIVSEGNEADVIVNTAIEQHVDMIMMTTHGRSGFSRWVMGSVTERVLREAKCPIMVTRHDYQTKRILIPLDGSVLSERALPVGFSIAEIDNATIVHLMRVYESSSEPGETAVKSYLDNCATAQSGIVAVKTAVIHGSPASSIIDYVENNEIDLIVIATHGRRGLYRWVYGSITEKILRDVECNILVVQSK